MLLRFLIVLWVSWPALVLAQDDWTGTWDSKYGPLRLVQDGNRVFGDYAARGRIEGRVQDGGTMLRGAFIYTDGRWGRIEFARDAESFSGRWRWSNGDVATGDGWTGRRVSADMPTLTAARPELGWPDDATEAELAELRAFAGDGDTAIADLDIGNGRWTGGYELGGLLPFALLSLNLDQVEGRAGGLAEVTLTPLLEGPCPDAMHPALCEEIASYQGQGSMALFVDGVTFRDPGEAFVAFTLGPDSAPSILRLQDAPGGGVEGQIIHPQRGIDWAGPVRQEPHLCSVAMCMGGRLAELAVGPLAGLGVFADGSFLAAYPFDRDQRRDPASGGGMTDEADWLNRSWLLFDMPGELIATLDFSRDPGGAPTAQGRIEIEPFPIPLARTDFFLRGTDGDRTDWHVIMQREDGQDAFGRLTLRDPASFADPLAHGEITLGEDTFEVVLVDPALSYEPTDLPGFGIYAAVYSLRNVPAGQDLVMRDAPDQAAPTVGRIPNDAREILVNACTPEIDNIAFEEARQETRSAMLDPVWCKVLVGDALGWVKGIYLLPND